MLTRLSELQDLLSGKPLDDGGNLSDDEEPGQARHKRKPTRSAVSDNKRLRRTKKYSTVDEDVASDSGPASAADQSLVTQSEEESLAVSSDQSMWSIPPEGMMSYAQRDPVDPLAYVFVRR